jgi:hypothetical protein
MMGICQSGIIPFAEVNLSGGGSMWQCLKAADHRILSLGLSHRTCGV